ncbi:MAG: LPS-assembly protein LptD, partial [Beijerinckiaceae bacterium]
MGRRICPSDSLHPGCAGGGRAPASQCKSAALARTVGCHALTVAAVFWLGLIFCFAVDWSLNSAAAQSSVLAESAPPPSNAKTAAEKPQKMFVEASELVYNKDKNTVSAEGNARVYYKGSVLEADRVVYDRNTGRVYAEGSAQLRQANGTILHADRFDLTEDFRDGFIKSLRAETTDRTYISAPQAERTEGNITVYDKGTYTACNSCREDPDKPPLWRVRAKKIIHNGDEQMLYYQGAWLEFAGVPVAYIPVFSAPDPSVTHKSGILSPVSSYMTQRGYGVGIPIYWAMAPSYDLTFTPTYYSNQGFLGSAEWRQKFDNGSYYILANGIFQQNPAAFWAS